MKAYKFVLVLIVSLWGALVSATQPFMTGVQIPNRTDYWKKAGFQEMVGILHLPTNTEKTDRIHVWLWVPENKKISVKWLPEQKRYSLKYPPGTIADRVETQVVEKNGEVVEDVRGARIGPKGEILFHVYEEAPKQSSQWLVGLEWPRHSDDFDRQSGEALVKLYFPERKPGDDRFVNGFRHHNLCTRCHQTNNAHPTYNDPDLHYASDSSGFFQPTFVLEERATVRTHRNWDLNPDDPFITVWCGKEEAPGFLSMDESERFYKCPDHSYPEGTLNMALALQAHDSHATQVCESRKYLYDHMNKSARRAFMKAFLECGIGQSR